MTDISEEKQIILQEIKKGHNIFITGPAGTGKSFLLKKIKELYQSSGLHVTASTGVAAVGIGGVTLHSWGALGLGNRPAAEIISFINSGKGTFVRRKIRKTRMLAIDEISMIAGDTLDLVDEVLKAVRNNDKPFGGIQVILFGDFLQLPPVNSLASNNNFCFKSDSWQNANFKIFCLNSIFRQSDQIFIKLLNNIRFGKLSSDDINLLESRRLAKPTGDIKPTLICTHNSQIDIINKKELDQLPGREYVFTMRSSGKEDKINFLKKNCLANENLVLKVGAQVMMLKNTLQKEGVINGSLGIIRSFSSEGFPVVMFSNGKIFTIENQEWLAEEFNHEKLETEVKARVVQIPLVLAWAITVHKSQGMTLDAIECDLARAFADGQVYVALSRVKTIEGLYISSFDPKYAKVNSSVAEFYQQLETA